MPVGVNETADDVFLDVVDDGDVNDSLATVYSADARLVTDVDHVGGDRPAAPESPGENWTLVGEDLAVTTDVEVADVTPACDAGGLASTRTLRTGGRRRPDTRPDVATRECDTDDGDGCHRDPARCRRRRRSAHDQ